MRLIRRYLHKEIYVTLFAVTAVLLFVFMSGEFITYLGLVAQGNLFVSTLFKLALIQIPIFLGLLLPLALYIAILLAYGRLFAESEMTVLQACGISWERLLKISLFPALLVTIMVSVVLWWIAPNLNRLQEQLIEHDANTAFLFAVTPGQFQKLGDSRVFYVESVDYQSGRFKDVFVAQKQNDGESWDVLQATYADQQVDQTTGNRFLVFYDGASYENKPGTLAYRITEFQEYSVRIEPSNTQESRYAQDTIPTWELLHSDEIQDRAELQWRISFPLAALVLTFLAVPLSRVKPRQGRFAKLVPAILLLIVYFNLLIMSRRWIASGVLPEWVGLWWVHLIYVMLALILFIRTKQI